jgi:uncharacterized iron-regulated membrane protein
MATIDTQGPSDGQRFYFAAWRWHFYAGLFVVPFLLMLAVTGAFMMAYDYYGNEMGYTADVVPSGTALAPSVLAKAALAAVPGGSVSTYITPASPTRPAFVEIAKGEAFYDVAVDPYTGKVLVAQDAGQTWRVWAEKVHGTLLIGDLGDRLIEAAASLSMLLMATGVYMWWPRKGVLAAFVPNLTAQGRGCWKEMHKVTGIWISAVLVVFLLTGLAWTGIWGDKFAKPWSGFPALKWDNVPQSDLTHADLNHTALHEVPWGLELVRLPASGSDAGQPAVAQPVVLDTVVMWAEANGFAGQYKVALPGGEAGVYSVSIDGRNGDGFSPSDDRFVHIDRYTGNILADIPYDAYPLLGKAMAWGIGLHKGQAGPVNFWFNVVYLALVVFLCVSGGVMWWLRRPVGASRLAAPPLPADLPMWKGAVLVGLFVAMVFPMAGVALLAVMLVDVVVLANLPVLKRALS